MNLKHLPENVEVVTESPLEWESGEQPNQDRPLRLTAPGASLIAEQLFVCTNAWAPALGVAQGRVFPVRTFASIVKSSRLPLVVDCDRWGVTSPERVGSSLRDLPDGRLQVRNLAYADFPDHRIHDELAQAQELHSKILQRRFPQIDDWEFDETWCGTVGVTANTGQWFGQAGPRVFASLGYNGHGIAQATVSGQLLVDLAMQQPSALLTMLQTLPRPWPVPGRWLLNPGIRTVMGYLNWRFREEI